MSQLFERNPFGALSAPAAAPTAPAAPSSSSAAASGARTTPQRFRWLAAAFGAGFLALAIQMALISMGRSRYAEDFIEISETPRRPPPITRARADLYDRHSRVLAASLPVWDIAYDKRETLSARDEATRIAALFGLDPIKLERDFLTPKPYTINIRVGAAPAEWEAAHDLGIPGLTARPRMKRFYPEGRLAAHVLGGVDIDGKGVAGIEIGLEDQITDAEKVEQPIRLSLDARAQAALEAVLGEASAHHAANGAAGVLMDARTGEILAMASSPDFDPNHRPAPTLDKDAGGDDPTFDRVAQGVYEIGSIFKTFTVSAALETRRHLLTDPLDARGPIRRGRFSIDDYKGKRRILTMAEGYMHSSNIAMARLSADVGPEQMSQFLRKLGFYDKVPIEFADAARGAPQPPRQWGPLETMTVGYGHGFAVSPLHVAAAAATLTNGGCLVRPTLLYREEIPPCVRVVEPDISQAARGLLRAVGQYTSGRSAAAPGYEVGGKTGTALKAKKGGYSQSARLASFLAVFPASAPRYVAIISLDDPKMLEDKNRGVRPTAGFTAAPAMRELIERAAPLLGLPPEAANEKSASEIIGGLYGGIDSSLASSGFLR